MSFAARNKKLKPDLQPNAVAAALPAVSALMAGHQEPLVFVPTPGSFPCTTNFQSIGGDDGRAHVLKMHHPPSQRLNQFLTETVTKLVLSGYPVGDHFKNGDTGLLEELFDMYDRVSTEPPTPLKKKLGDLNILSGNLAGSSYTPKQEFQVGIVPLVASLHSAQCVNQRCRMVFGVGASTLASPLTLIIGTLDQTDFAVKHLIDCSKNENPVGAPDLKSPPFVNSKVAAYPCPTLAAAAGFGDKAYESPRASLFGPPPAYTPLEVTVQERSPPKSDGHPPFTPAQSSEAMECSGWLWMPRRCDWLAVVQTEGCPYPMPDDVTKMYEFRGWVFAPRTKTWYKPQ